MVNRDVDERLRDLEQAVEELTEELGADERHQTTGGRRGFPGFVRDVAVPAGILAVEAQLRTLEFLSERIREANARAGDQSSLDDWSGEARDHSVATLDRLDGLLDRLERELEAGRLPARREARELIGEVRRLQEDVRNQLADEEAGRSEAVTIDVESELETIRDEVGEDESDGTT